ncbi:MAG: hypothetical protein LBP36_00140 [Oscillospiraceae bacterium]|nr:hypothetical protein [Oscillospiraceae bacterium]
MPPISCILGDSIGDKFAKIADPIEVTKKIWNIEENFNIEGAIFSNSTNFNCSSSLDGDLIIRTLNGMNNPSYWQHTGAPVFIAVGTVSVSTFISTFILSKCIQGKSKCESICEAAKNAGMWTVNYIAVLIGGVIGGLIPGAIASTFFTIAFSVLLTTIFVITVKCIASCCCCRNKQSSSSLSQDNVPLDGQQSSYGFDDLSDLSVSL